MKGFKYQITVKVSLSKQKGNGNIEFAPAFFNFTTIRVLNLKYGLKKYFQEILYRIDNQINEGSAGVIESVDAEFVKISILQSIIRKHIH